VSTVIIHNIIQEVNEFLGVERSISSVNKALDAILFSLWFVVFFYQLSHPASRNLCQFHIKLACVDHFRKGHVSAVRQDDLG